MKYEERIEQTNVAANNEQCAHTGATKHSRKSDVRTTRKSEGRKHKRRIVTVVDVAVIIVIVKQHQGSL